MQLDPSRSFIQTESTPTDPYKLYRLPDPLVTITPDAVQLRLEGRTLSYVSGIGWTPANAAAAPVVREAAVLLDGGALELLDVSLPRLEGVRASQGERVRVVFDVRLPDRRALEELEREGSLAAGETLILSLPHLLLPQTVPETVYGLALSVTSDFTRTNITLSGPPLRYRVFSLDNPTRLVVDAEILGAAPIPGVPLAAPEVTPDKSADLTDTAEDAEAEFDRRDNAALVPPEPERSREIPPTELYPGVVYRRLVRAIPEGDSLVDIVDIAPGRGEFRVVGAPTGARTLSDLSSGSLVGINAGYFDTQTLRAIGLLEVDDALLSYPSRNRASIGFGVGAPVISRIEAELRVRIDGRLYYSGTLTDDRVNVYTVAGGLAGRPDQGVITVAQGRVVENKVGPRRVPEEGFAIAYDPHIRELALVDEGNRAAIESDFSPSAFNRVRYAVEAGPLLVQGGRPALEPGLEAFDTVNPRSPVNRRTTRAAVGVKPDGTVLFVTATNMTTRDLVPLFLSLGAEHALQMDSGGSSTLYAAGEVLNRPAYMQRKVSTAIVFVPHGGVTDAAR